MAELRGGRLLTKGASLAASRAGAREALQPIGERLLMICCRYSNA
jgi:hypothetical protein